jgi:hypothetical protein
MPQQSEFIGFTQAREKTKTHYWVDAVVTDIVLADHCLVSLRHYCMYLVIDVLFPLTAGPASL